MKVCEYCNKIIGDKDAIEVNNHYYCSEECLDADEDRLISEDYESLEADYYLSAMEDAYEALLDYYDL